MMNHDDDDDDDDDDDVPVVFQVDYAPSPSPS